MGDIILLIGRKGVEIDAGFVKSEIDENTTVVSVHIPHYSSQSGMNKDEWIGAHHQHGVDLARVEHDLKLRDVVLVTLPKPETCRLGMLHVWTSPESTYDIDSVRIPWEEVEEHLKRTGGFKKGWKPDSRNNPAGKNPTNFWHFSTLPGNLEPITTLERYEIQEGPREINTTLSSGMELDAFERVFRAHSIEDGLIQIWAEDDDYEILGQMATSLNRRVARVPEGECDQFTPIRRLISTLPIDVKVDNEDSPETVSKTIQEVEAIARIQDCREGISEIIGNPITHVVTSPPYNIGYQPFNDPKPNSSGDLVTPVREGYEDDLSPEQYAALLQSTFDGIDSKANSDSFDLFLNIKSNYSGGDCDLPFYMLELMPERWRLLDILVWRYDISFDPGRGKYKPLYEWVIRVGFGEVDLPEFGMLDWYIPILKGNSIERRELKHPAMFPRELVTQCLKESNRPADLVLDPFLGSGTTLAACLEAGVNSLGFELSPQFSTDISKRLEWVKWAGNGELKRA